MHATFVSSIDKIAASAWDTLFPGAYPFIQHAFLLSLEQSGAVSAASGWQPYHLLIFNEQDQPIAAMPWYLKSHSYGEYFFDWAFAEAYQQHQLRYYPKLLNAIPFTPATGPRLGLNAEGQRRETEVWAVIQQQLQEVAAELGLSSAHSYYVDTESAPKVPTEHWLKRLDIQFHWQNKHYRCFADFLAELTSRKRKSIQKERQRVADQDLTIQVFEGPAIDPAMWQQFYDFYRLTYAKRSGHMGYLSLATFRQWGAHLAGSIVMFVAKRNSDNDCVAAALCFKDDTTLYGRYWGCRDEYDFLHFEACYYQGIDYCIARGLTRFDAGAQGEHKLHRGFEPVLQYGFLQLFNSPFQAAIADYCQRECEQLQLYQQQAIAQLPFRQV